MSVATMPSVQNRSHVADHRRGHHVERDHDDRDHRAVQQVAAEVRRGEEVAVVREVEPARERPRQRSAGGLGERDGDHPEERQQHREQQRAEPEPPRERRSPGRRRLARALALEIEPGGAHDDASVLPTTRIWTNASTSVIANST
jgi:hypothetical protein